MEFFPEDEPKGYQMSSIIAPKTSKGKAVSTGGVTGALGMLIVVTIYVFRANCDVIRLWDPSLDPGVAVALTTLVAAGWRALADWLKHRND